MNFADTNWLRCVYIPPVPNDAEAAARQAIVDRFMRRHGERLTVSQIVLLEARNVFARITGHAKSREWENLEADFGARISIDPMDWDLLQQECNTLFGKYAWKAELGTLDTAIVASAKLAGATRFLSFDVTARMLAFAESLEIFPILDPADRARAMRLKRHH